MLRHLGFLQHTITDSDSSMTKFCAKEGLMYKSRSHCMPKTRILVEAQSAGVYEPGPNRDSSN